MTNPREYPDVMQSAESGRLLRRGVKMLTIEVAGQSFTYDSPDGGRQLTIPQTPKAS
jgi:hypothetical protein